MWEINLILEGKQIYKDSQDYCFIIVNMLVEEG